MSKKKVSYRKISVKGNAYEAGRQLAEYLKEDEALIRLMTSPFMGGAPIAKEQLDNVKGLLDRYCPGTNEEIQGFADALGVDPGQVIYYYAYLYPRGCNCSQLAVTPALTQDSHTYLARNYEFSWDDAPILLETDIEGQYRQIGFACQLFGRFDGMNEHGLCVATSAGVIQAPYQEEGFVFPVAVRAILNSCKTVPEALELFQTLPFADYRNLCLADSEGNIARIQAAASLQSVDHNITNHEIAHFAAANHYEAEVLKQKKFYTPKHSLERLKIIESFVDHRNKQHQRMSNSDLQRLFALPMPDGVCCHYYEAGMGTMWSELFDATNRTMQVCFGSPDDHKWTTFSIGSNQDIKEYEVILSSVEPPEGFWEDSNR